MIRVRLKVEHGTDDVKLSTKCMNLAVEACNIGANGLIHIAQQKQEAAERKVDNLEQQVRIERRRHMQCIVKLAAARLDASRKEVIVTVTVSVVITVTVTVTAIVVVTVFVTVLVVVTITFTGIITITLIHIDAFELCQRCHNCSDCSDCSHSAGQGEKDAIKLKSAQSRAAAAVLKLRGSANL